MERKRDHKKLRVSHLVNIFPAIWNQIIEFPSLSRRNHEILSLGYRKTQTSFHVTLTGSLSMNIPFFQYRRPSFSSTQLLINEINGKGYHNVFISLCAQSTSEVWSVLELFRYRLGMTGNSQEQTAVT
jgi:hypothetical protein